ncbi:MAG: hypothetical protein Q9205_003985 [Flavoplaca limonia]
MPSSSSICRSFWALLCLLLSVLLVYILGGQFEKPSHYLSYTSDRNVPIYPVRFVAIPCGQQTSKLEFSPVSLHNTRVGKRALDYQNLVDTGKGFVCQINDAFQGTATAGTVFADDALKDGWTVDPINQVPPRIWNGFFKDNGFKFPEPADKVNIELRQDKPYHNKAGEFIQEPIEKSIYSLYYIPAAKMMMAINIRSPSHELKIKYPSISNDDLAGRLPRIHRFSDVAWKVWSGLPNNDPGSLRYISHDYVSNPTTDALRFAVIKKCLGRVYPSG